VNTLILESASPGIEDHAERALRRASDDALAQRILDMGVESFVAEWENVPLLALQPHVPPPVRQRQHELRLHNSPTGLANSLRGMGAGQQRPLWNRLAQLDLPVHLIVGSSDQRYVAVATRMSALLPQARLTVVQGAGHTVHVDQPDTVVRLVRDALTNRVTPADFPMSTN
jgi:2-succinyl-6-hydroxy-2,4-cyclohexadiene-1-carboxylate synthase